MRRPTASYGAYGACGAIYFSFFSGVPRTRASTRLAGPLPLRDRALRVSEAHPRELSKPVQRRQVPRERVHLLVVERQAACERTLKGGVHMADEQR